jgi:hypothetical protein
MYFEENVGKKMKSFQSSRYRHTYRTLLLALSVMGLFVAVTAISGCGPDPTKEKPPAGYYEGPMKPKGAGAGPKEPGV